MKPPKIDPQTGEPIEMKKRRKRRRTRKKRVMKANAEETDEDGALYVDDVLEEMSDSDREEYLLQ